MLAALVVLGACTSADRKAGDCRQINPDRSVLDTGAENRVTTPLGDSSIKADGSIFLTNTSSKSVRILDASIDDLAPGVELLGVTTYPADGSTGLFGMEDSFPRGDPGTPAHDLDLEAGATVQLVFGLRFDPAAVPVEIDSFTVHYRDGGCRALVPPHVLQVVAPKDRP